MVVFETSSICSRSRHGNFTADGPGEPLSSSQQRLISRQVSRKNSLSGQTAENELGATFSRPNRRRWSLCSRHTDRAPRATEIASPSPTTRGNLTAYIVYLDGVKLEAVADTGSAVSVISQKVIKRNPKTWNVISHVADVAVCNGQIVPTSGYVQASFRFEGSEELHHLILHIIDGLPHDMLLSHDVLVRTGTVEFKRPGAIAKAGLYPAGSEHPAVALVLTTLVAAKRPSITDWLKRLFRIRLRSRQGPPTMEGLAGSFNNSCILICLPCLFSSIGLTLDSIYRHRRRDEPSCCSYKPTELIGC